MKRCWFLLFLAMFCHATTSVPPPAQIELHRGFGSHLNWRTYKDACEDSARTGKPVMLLFHQKWCKACRLLMPSFSQSPHIAKMAPLFEMVNLMDEEEPMDEKFQPDGVYYPRILFMGADGVVRTEITNPEVFPREPYKYYHSDALTVARAMMKAIRTFYNVEEAGENEL